MSKLKEIKVTENRAGGEIFSYHLITQRGEGQSWGMEIMNADEMRQIAKMLLAKANEIEKESKNG